MKILLFLSLLLFCIGIMPAQLTVGQTEQMTATCHYTDGSSQTCNTKDTFGDMATWLSSAPNVATLNMVGNLTALTPGTTTVTASIGTINGTAQISVVAVPVVTLSSVSLSAKSTSIQHGTDTQLIATCHYSDGSSKTCPTVNSWAIQSSGTNGVGTVSSNGYAYGIIKGVCRYIATVGTISSNALPVTFN